MATSTSTIAASTSRGRPINSGSGTVAPLNTPTRRFYGSQDQLEIREPSVANPNIYVVQPFKNASLPKDLVYAKKNAPNPGEELLNSTIGLIEHFTSCYELLKHQLQDEHAKARENLLISRPMTNGGTNRTISQHSLHRPAKQARLQPLNVRHNAPNSEELFVESCAGILPVPMTKSNDLSEIYSEKLRLLHKLRPELFDSQGNLLSHSIHRSHSFSQTSAISSKKSATSSFRTPHNTLFSVENTHFDDRRTFLTEFTNEDEDNEHDEDESKLDSVISTQQPNSVNEFMNKNYVIKVLEIKTITAPSAKRDRTKSGSDQTNSLSRKGNVTAKSN